MFARFTKLFVVLGTTICLSVVGAVPAAATAGDGVTWVAQGSIPSGEWKSVTYGNGRFVAVGATGSYVMTSSDGVTWIARTPAENNYWQSVTYGNSLFVAVASTGTNRVMTSPDGITWTPHAATAAVAWHAVSYGNNVFVAVGDSGNVMTSSDGSTWSAQTSAVPSFSWQRLVFGGGTFVSLAPSNGAQNVMTSTDGVTWTRQSFPDAASWYYLAYGNGFFVARTATGGYIATSPNGVTWTRRASGAANNAGVYFGNSTFVSLPSGQVQVSTDNGVTWSNHAASPNGLGFGTFAEGLFVVVGNSSVMTSGNFSPQQVTWNPSNTSTTTGSSPLTPSASAVRTPSDGGSLSYGITSAGTTGCSVNPTTGDLTFTAAGTCAVTATAAATPAYSAASTTISFTITDPVSAPAPTSGGTSNTSAQSGGGGSLQTITEVRPATGPLAGGNTIAIIGYGFTGATSVTIGGAQAAYRVVNDAHVEVVVPSGAALGASDVAVNLTPERGRAFAPGGYVYTANSVISDGPTTVQPGSVISTEVSSGLVASPSRARTLPRGFTILSQVGDQRVIQTPVRTPVNRVLSKAPTLQLNRGQSHKYTVNGMPTNENVVVQVGIGGRYFGLGSSVTSPNGTLTLPAFSAAQKGGFRLRFTPISGLPSFLRLKVS